MWAASEIASKREKYRDVMGSLQEQYKIYKFTRQFVDSLKENSNNHKDRRSSSTSESDAGTGNKPETDHSDNLGTKDDDGNKDEISMSCDIMATAAVTSLATAPSHVGLGLTLETGL